MSQYGFHNLITISTRVSNQCQSLLDQMWINFKSDFRPFVFQCAISDHFPVGMTFPVRCNSTVKQTIIFRLFNVARLNCFRADLESDFEFVSDSLESCKNNVNNFMIRLEQLCVKQFPLRSKTVTSLSFKNPWISTELKQCIKKKHKLFRMYKSGFIQFRHFKLYRNMLRKALRLAKKCYYTDKINNCSYDSSKM